MAASPVIPVSSSSSATRSGLGTDDHDKCKQHQTDGEQHSPGAARLHIPSPVTMAVVRKRNGVKGQGQIGPSVDTRLMAILADGARPVPSNRGDDPDPAAGSAITNIVCIFVAPQRQGRHCEAEPARPAARTR